MPLQLPVGVWWYKFPFELFYYFSLFFFFESSSIQSLLSLMERLLFLDEFWICFLAWVSVLGIKFDRPLGWSLMAVIDCRVLVIFTLHEVVEMTQGCRVICGEGTICHFVARRDLQEWHFEAWYYCSVLIEASDGGCFGELKERQNKAFHPFWWMLNPLSWAFPGRSSSNFKSIDLHFL